MWLVRSASAPLTSSQSGMERSSTGSYREASKQDSVGEISEKNITGTKQVIDDAAARFWAKRGLQDPSKSRRAKLTGSKLIKKYKQAELVKIVKLGELSL